MKMICMSLCMALFSPVLLASGGPAPTPKEKSLEKSYTQYLIRYESEDISLEERKRILEKWGAKELEKVGSHALYLIELSPDGQAKEKSLAGLKKEKGVRFVEPNFRLELFNKSGSEK